MTGSLREMAYKEELVDRDIFHSHAMFLVYFNHLVDKQERIAMRKKLAYAVNVNYRLVIRVIVRRLDLSVAHFPANHLRELAVDGVAGRTATTLPFIGRPISARSPITSISLWRAGSLSHLRGCGFM